VKATPGILRSPHRRAKDGSHVPPAGVNPHSVESLAHIRAEARRERLLDMEERVRPYRTACFAILAVSLAIVGPQVGWWWVAPLTVGFLGFAVADRFMRASERPWLWVAGAWGALPLLLGVAVIATGGPDSPAVVLFALPAVTLGARFEPWGMVVGTIYIFVLFLACTVGVDPAGAWDASQQLVAAGALIVSTVILSAALAASDRAHREQSTLDPLTNLFNRNALEQRLSELDGMPSSEAEGLSHALLLCDLDHFKRINDQLGHAAGDAVLQDVAYTMRATLRAGDSIYRVGGEEILVVLPSANEEDAIEIAERLRVAVRERRPVGTQVTVSIGVAVSGEGGVDTDDLIARADAALYAAKAGGRDRISVDSSAGELATGELASGEPSR
jgi:diguanylate cyclase (GGDEF)-like protein